MTKRIWLLCGLYCSILLAGYHPASVAEERPELPEGVSANWFDAVAAHISASEYHFHATDKAHCYIVGNRSNNIYGRIEGRTLMLHPREPQGESWEVYINLLGIGRAGHTQLSAVAEAGFAARNNTLQVRHEDFAIEYENDSKGLRQNFVLYRRPAGQGELHVRLQCRGDLVPRAQGANSAVFVRPAEHPEAGKQVVAYRDLYVFDARGAHIPARMDVQDDRISLVVDDAAAVYPLTVDPLAATPDWSNTSSQSACGFGQEIAPAGDVNGDGYSDFLIGAPNFDVPAGMTILRDAGRVFLYFGSATGPNPNPNGYNWFVEGDRADGRLGTSVSTAGDVNGDGISDIIIGAPFYSYCCSGGNGAALTIAHGAAFVWHGPFSTTVTPETPPMADWRASICPAMARFGYSVSTAGDVNGDGYSDVIIGAPILQTEFPYEGAVFMWYGGPGGLGDDGNGTNADWCARAGVQDAHFGYSVAAAGDVDGDGFQDVIIGSPRYSHYAPGTIDGAAFIWTGSAAGMGAPAMAANADWISVSDFPNNSYGYCVSTAGDVNGDGYADVLVGSYNYVNEGSAWMYYGSPVLSPVPVISNQANWQVRGGFTAIQMGQDVFTAGDVNGDGYADVVIGAPHYQTDRGGVFVWYGSGNGLNGSSTTPGGYTIQSPLDADWSYVGQPGMRIGRVATAGDVNGDGYSDILCGSASNASGSYVNGVASLFYGGPVGVVNPAAQWLGSQGGNDDLFGFAVSTAGDVNGDGYADIIVGAPLYDNGGVFQSGGVWIYAGGPNGVNGVPIATGGGSTVGDHFGWSVSTAGDFNNDGFSDILVGEPTVGGNTGKVYLFTGPLAGTITPATELASGVNIGDRFGFAVSTAGDVNGDGFSDVIVGAPRHDPGGLNDAGAAYAFFGTATPVWPAIPNVTFTGSQTGENFGWCVSSAGDINGDGFSDVVIGAPHKDAPLGGPANTGAVYGFLGWSSAALSTATGPLYGQNSGDEFGCSAATAGDVNADGYSDVIIGARNFASGLGAAYLWVGAPTPPSATPLPFAVGVQTGQQFGYSVSTAGDLNGDGYSDMIVGSPYFNAGPALEAGHIDFFYGDPNLVFQTNGWTLGQVSTNYGFAVCTAGDINGDGYSDVLVGAPNESFTNPGQIFAYFGNGGACLDRLSMQFDMAFTRPIQNNNGFDDPSCGYKLLHRSRSAMGRVRGKLVWESFEQGLTFSGWPDISTSTSYTGQETNWNDIALPWNPTLADEYPGFVILAKTRLRTRFHPATMIDGQVFSRWFYMGIHDRQAMSISADPPCGPAKAGRQPAQSSAFVPQNGSPEDYVYPNPVGDELRFVSGGAEADPVRMQIVDAAGRVLAERDLSTAGSAGGDRADVRTLPAGSYTLRLLDAAGQQVRAIRFVKN